MTVWACSQKATSQSREKPTDRLRHRSPRKNPRESLPTESQKRSDERGSCDVLKNHNPILKDRNFRDFPASGCVWCDLSDFSFFSAGGIEEKSPVLPLRQVAKLGLFIRGRGECKNSFSGNPACKGHPIVFLAPSRVNEIRLGLQLPPRIAREEFL